MKNKFSIFDCENYYKIKDKPDEMIKRNKCELVHKKAIVTIHVTYYSSKGLIFIVEK